MLIELRPQSILTQQSVFLQTKMSANVIVKCFWSILASGKSQMESIRINNFSIDLTPAFKNKNNLIAFGP